MKYMVLIYGDERALSEAERSGCYLDSARLARDLASEGKYVAAAPLHTTSMATSIRTRDDGKRVVTDGPYVETKEQLGGYFMVDVDNLDEAVKVANRIPAAKWGGVEIRPVLEIEGLPSE